MDSSARWAQRIGWGLVVIGAVFWSIGSFVTGGNDFRVMTAALFLYVPGVLLALFGYSFGQLDQRLRALEQKIEPLSPDPGPQEKTP